jgi:hypothetical protein
VADSKFKLAYAGVRLASGDKLAHAWAPVEDHADLRLYKKPLVRYAGIGAVYEFTGDDEGRIFTGGEKAPRRLPDAFVDDDTRLMWEAVDSDHRIEHETIQISKREKDVSLLAEALLPIRVAMARRPGRASRSAITNAVAAELMRPLTKAERAAAGV